MKSFAHFLFAIVILITAAGFDAFAQSSQYSRKYRVVAYKFGNPQVWSMSNEVEVIPSMTLYIPSSFTPNGDGMNDLFGVYGQAIKEFNMKVYNRWGQMIFESGNLSDQWDGTYLGEPVQEGAYVYTVSATGPKGNKSLRNGTVTVVN